MFSRPKILFLVSLLFVALLNPKLNPYLLFKFLIFYHSSIYSSLAWPDPFSACKNLHSFLQLFSVLKRQLNIYSMQKMCFSYTFKTGANLAELKKTLMIKAVLNTKSTILLLLLSYSTRYIILVEIETIFLHCILLNALTVYQI